MSNHNAVPASNVSTSRDTLTVEASSPTDLDDATARLTHLQINDNATLSPELSMAVEVTQNVMTAEQVDIESIGEENQEMSGEQSPKKMRLARKAGNSAHKTNEVPFRPGSAASFEG